MSRQVVNDKVYDIEGYKLCYLSVSPSRVIDLISDNYEYKIRRLQPTLYIIKYFYLLHYLEL